MEFEFKSRKDVRDSKIQCFLTFYPPPPCLQHVEVPGKNRTLTTEATPASTVTMLGL